MNIEQIIKENPEQAEILKAEVAKLYQLDKKQVEVTFQNDLIIVKEKEITQVERPNPLKAIYEIAKVFGVKDDVPLDSTDHHKIRNLKNKGGTLKPHNVIKHNTGRNEPCHCGSGKKRKLCCKYQNPKTTRN